MATRFFVKKIPAENAARASGKVVPNLIIDVGMNTGQDTAFYLSQGYHVVAVEADPELAADARGNFAAEIASGRLCVVNAGIAEANGTTGFWVCDNKREFNSFHRGIAGRDSRSHHRIQVRTIPFSTVLEEYGVPYYLKIDIEGNDMLCLDGIRGGILPPYVSVESECPVDGASDGDPLSVLKRLRDLGYRWFKLIDQLTFCALALPASPHHLVDEFCRRTLLGPMKHLPGTYRASGRLLARSRLERQFGRTFVPGSSGVWGEDTLGRWTGYDEAARAYAHYRQSHFSSGNAQFYSFWCDWHAKA